MLETGRLVVSCQDRPGIVAGLSAVLFALGANVIHSDQHSTDHFKGNVAGLFLLRIEFDLENFSERINEVRSAFSDLEVRFNLDLRVEANRKKKIAIFVSREDHCLLEILWAIRAGDLEAEVQAVVGNHPLMAEIVAPYNVPFHCVPISAEIKSQAEAQQMEICAGVDAIVLARYMQILSPEMCQKWQNRVINIHHSFLPAFIGANPYRQAFERGVKLIGATAHYVTPELDGGPIIDQDVERVDHRCDALDLQRQGRLIERRVLARALKWHCEDRVLVYENKTVVFS